jgi:hypothetical protein
MTAVQITQSSQNSADASSRRGDLTLRIRHYQTAAAARQSIAMSALIATINRDAAGRMTGNKLRFSGAEWRRVICGARLHAVPGRAALQAERRGQCDPSHIVRCAVNAAVIRAPRLTFADDNGLVPASANPNFQEK